MMGGSSLNGAPGPSGEELGAITRVFEAHHEFLFIAIPLVFTYVAIMRW